MNKRNTRAFAFGVLVSVLIMGSAYFFNTDDLPADAKLDESSAKEFLIREGYIVLTEEEHASLLEPLHEDSKETAANSEEQTEKHPPESPTAYHLKIASGMTPGEIAEQLEKENIVDDAAEFSNYLDEYGYSKKVQLGTFELNNQMSYKDIAKKITKS